MNARQKAKKYKRLYKLLLKSQVNYHVNTVNFDDIIVERAFTDEMILSGNIDENFIKKMMSRYMIEKIMPFLEIRSYSIPELHLYKVSARLRVVHY